VYFVAEALGGAGHLVVQAVETLAADVPEFDVLERVPDALVRAQLGHGPWQALRPQSPDTAGFRYSWIGWPRGSEGPSQITSSFPRTQHTRQRMNAATSALL